MKIIFRILNVLTFINILASTVVNADVKTVDRQGQQIQINNYNFTNENGEIVSLASFFNPKKPVFLVPVYFDCPGVCTLTLNQLFENLKKIKFNPGKALEVVVFSINPNEKSDLALKKKNNYLHRFKYEDYSDGFHFLVTDQKQITELTQELGFFYEKAEDGFNHPGATYLMTPEGKISKLLTAKNPPLKKLKDYVYQAAHGRKISAFEKMVLSCKKKSSEESP